MTGAGGASAHRSTRRRQQGARCKSTAPSGHLTRGPVVRRLLVVVVLVAMLGLFVPTVGARLGRPAAAGGGAEVGFGGGLRWGNGRVGGVGMLRLRPSVPALYPHIVLSRSLHPQQSAMIGPATDSADRRAQRLRRHSSVRAVGWADLYTYIRDQHLLIDAYTRQQSADAGTYLPGAGTDKGTSANERGGRELLEVGCLFVIFKCRTWLDGLGWAWWMHTYPRTHSFPLLLGSGCRGAVDARHEQRRGRGGAVGAFGAALNGLGGTVLCG